MRKREDALEKTFLDLPPRVVIMKILPFHELCARNMAICANDKFIIDSFIEFKRIISLNVIIGTDTVGEMKEQSFLRQIIEVSPQMRNLESLNIGVVKNVSEEMLSKTLSTQLFSKESCFPNLENLCISSDILLLDNWKFHEDTIIFRRLKRVHLTRAKVLNHEERRGIVDTILKNVGEKLERMVLISQFASEKIELHLPNIKELIIEDCRNISVKPEESGMKKLIYIDQLEIQPFVERIYRRSRSLKVLGISVIGPEIESIPKFDNYWLLSPTNLNNLKRVSLGGVGVMSNLASFGEGIEEVCISFCKFMAEDIFLHPYPKLRIFQLEGKMGFDRPTRKWSFVQNTEKIFISFQNETDFEDHFLALNDFGGLRELIIGYSSSLFMETKKVMPNLEYLDLSNCENLSDEFFRSPVFPKLKKLFLLRNDKVTGSGWLRQNVENLEELVVNECKRFSDRFFREQDLEDLEVMGIALSPELGSGITGTKWNKLPNLKRLGIIGHRYGYEPLRDDMFENGTLEGLEELKFGLKKLPYNEEEFGRVDLGSERWKLGMPVLKEFGYVKEMKKFFKMELFEEGVNKFLPSGCVLVEE